MACSRRNFLKAGFAAGALAGAGKMPLYGAKDAATEWVTLGKSGVKVTRLAFGTGSVGGRVQRNERARVEIRSWAVAAVGLIRRIPNWQKDNSFLSVDRYRRP